MSSESEVNYSKKSVDTRKRPRKQTTTPEESTPKRIKPNSELQQARKLLSCTSSPCLLPGRETQLEELQKFILNNTNSAKNNSPSNCLYVSGPPGTGKTAAILQILHEASSAFQAIFINCTSTNPSSIFKRLAAELGINTRKTQKKSFLVESISETLRNKIGKGQKKKVLLILDEIDQLAGSSRRQSVLYDLFQMCVDHKSSLALIGVANVLDFTQRLLPRLVHPPQLLHFPPYTKPELVAIFRSRLQEPTKDLSGFFSGGALEMLAGKVSAVSGDARRALHLAGKLLELDGASSVKPQTVQAALDNISCNETEAIPLQQKIVICSLILLLRERKTKLKGVTLGELQEVYTKLCKKNNVQCIEYDFLGVCLLLETRGVISLTKNKKLLRMSKVSLRSTEDDIALNLKADGFCAKILGDM